MASSECPKKEEERKKPTIPQIKRLESKEEWISEEELYTEGSSDEDDMALRMKRRERRENARRKAEAATRLKEQNEQNRAPVDLIQPEQPSDQPGQQTSVQPSEQQLTLKGDNLLAPTAGDQPALTLEQEEEDECYMWRPTQGSFKLKHRADSEEKAASKTPAEWRNLQDAYQSMHKMDALLKESDHKVKEAQAETLRAQIATRSQLREMCELQGEGNVPFARNLDAFVQLCPLDSIRTACQGLAKGGAGDGSDSVLPRLIDQSDLSEDEYVGREEESAITDDEKMKLVELLRDLNADDTQAQDLAGGYDLDPEAQRALDEIDAKLRELDLQCSGAQASATEIEAKLRTASQAPCEEDHIVSPGEYRRRLKEIDRSLESLAASAVEQVTPVGEAELQKLLEQLGSTDTSVAAPQGPGLVRGGGEFKPTQSTPRDQQTLRDLVEEARKDMPRFQFRHHQEIK